MDDRVATTLAEQVAKYGPDLASDAQRVKGLLLDLHPTCTPEIAVIVAAAEEGIAEQLRSPSKGMVDARLAGMATRLTRNRWIDAPAARWAVDTWARALGADVPPPPPNGGSEAVQDSDGRIPHLNIERDAKTSPADAASHTTVKRFDGSGAPSRGDGGDFGASDVSVSPESFVGRPAYEYRPEVKGGLFERKKRQDNVERKTLRVVVGPVGIFWSDGEEVVAARWQDIPYVWQGITHRYVNGMYAGTDYRYAIQLSDGRTKTFIGNEFSVFKGLQGPPKLFERPEGPGAGRASRITLAQLGNVIEQGVTSVQLPRAVQVINAGQVVSFGALWVSGAGIGHGHHKLRWDEVQDVKVEHGLIQVKKAGKWLTWETVPVALVPNFFVFIALVRSLLGRRSGAAPH